MTAERFARFAGMPVITAIIFYLNYLWVVPKILLKQKTIRYFVVNAVIIVGGIAGIEQWERTIPHERQEIVSTHHKPYPRPHQHRHMPPPVIGFFRFQCFVTFMLGAGLAAAIRSTQHWRQTEEKRKEAELGKVEAELKNLRNQINPHFLLNTLNNIYALTAFDTAKAQKAIMELSKMMRHLLYDNQQQFVAIDKEINFLKNYIELMRIRQNDNVEIEFNTHISEHSSKEIAPLILISLVENAFKHGVSPTEHSCISINIREEKDCIECNITKNLRNSK